MKKCTQCGVKVLEGERFCGNCGNNLMVPGAIVDEEIQGNFTEYEESNSSHFGSENYAEEDASYFTQDSGSQSYIYNSNEFSGYQPEPASQAYEQQYAEANCEEDSVSYSYPTDYEQGFDYPVSPRRFDEKSLPEKYRPVSTWAFFGYGLLFGIPLAGLILAIVFAISDKNINRRNYARSVIIIYVIILILGTIGFFVFKEIIYSLLRIISML